MPVEAFFAFQLAWFLVAWSTVAVVLVAPRLRGWSEDDVLSFWVAPQLFRVAGVGLLVPNLSPGMPISFAAVTAVGDSATALLALIALIALRGEWPQARALVWACTLFGALDLAIALPHAAHSGAARHLEAQWYVPALGVPLMLVAHAMALRTLLTGCGGNQ